VRHSEGLQKQLEEMRLVMETAGFMKEIASELKDLEAEVQHNQVRLTQFLPIIPRF